MNSNITVANIIEVTKGKLIWGKENIICGTFCRDTRQIQKGQVYVGIQGENFNGSELYEEALQNGATVCLLQNVEINKENLHKYENCAIILVENTVKALQQIAAYKKQISKIPVVAITGSVGKTSTKDMVASVLSQKYKVLKTQGNHNNEIGMPLTILSLQDEELMVLEMGMNSFGEISLLTNIAKPDVAIITNIGTAHIGKLGSRENILKAKLEILEGLTPNGTVIINHDNDLLHSWYEKEKKNYKIITYGIENGSDIQGTNIQLNENGSTCKVDINGKTYTINIPVGGEHFVSNSLCAIAVAQVFNIPMEQALKGIEHFELTKKRMEIKKAKVGATVINDCYNANYDSMKAALTYLGSLQNERKIAVLGDMLELGAYSKTLHEQVGEEVVNNKVSLLVCVGEEAKYIAKKAEEKGMKKENIFCFINNQEAIRFLEKNLQKEDAILIKASNSLNFTQICEAICENN